jgi:hypothetical protein
MFDKVLDEGLLYHKWVGAREFTSASSVNSVTGLE